MGDSCFEQKFLLETSPHFLNFRLTSLSFRYWKRTERRQLLLRPYRPLPLDMRLVRGFRERPLSKTPGTSCLLDLPSSLCTTLRCTLLSPTSPTRERGLGNLSEVYYFYFFESVVLTTPPVDSVHRSYTSVWTGEPLRGLDLKRHRTDLRD